MKRVILTVVMILAATAIVSAQQPNSKPIVFKKSSIGVGLGIPYGVLGTNFDVNVAPNLNLSAGLGTTVLAGAGMSFGAKYFFTPPSQTFRPRVSAYYGTNAMVAVESPYGFTDDSKSYSGLTLGIGSQWLWGESKSNGMDFDVMFIATSSMDLDEYRDRGMMVEEPGRVKISVGYRRAL